MRVIAAVVALSLVFVFGTVNFAKLASAETIFPISRSLSFYAHPIFVKNNNSDLHFPVFKVEIWNEIAVIIQESGQIGTRCGHDRYIVSGANICREFRGEHGERRIVDRRFWVSIISASNNEFNRSYSTFATSAINGDKNNTAVVGGLPVICYMNVNNGDQWPVGCDELFPRQINAVAGQFGLYAGCNPQGSCENGDNASGQQAKKAVVSINQIQSAEVFDYEGAGECEITIFGSIVAAYVGYALFEIWSYFCFKRQKRTINKKQPRR